MVLIVMVRILNIFYQLIHAFCHVKKRLNVCDHMIDCIIPVGWLAIKSRYLHPSSDLRMQLVQQSFYFPDLPNRKESKNIGSILMETRCLPPSALMRRGQAPLYKLNIVLFGSKADMKGLFIVGISKIIFGAVIQRFL